MKSLDPFSIVIALNHLSDVVASASNVNFSKDYIMPILVVFLSAATAYLIAVKGYHYQELFRNERNKAATFNTAIIQMQTMHANLITLKQNYFREIQTHPVQRAVNFPFIPLRIDNIMINMSELVQLLLEAGSKQDGKPWLQIRSFLATYANFNMVIDMLTIRNQLDGEVKSKLHTLVKNSDNTGEIKIKDVIESIDDVLLMKYVDITELLIRRIDDLLITIDDFNNNFPSYAQDLLKKKYLKGYVYIKCHQNDTEFYKESIARCNEVDLVILGNMMKLKEQNVKEKYLDSSVVIVTPKS